LELDELLELELDELLELELDELLELELLELEELELLELEELELLELEELELLELELEELLDLELLELELEELELLEGPGVGPPTCELLEELLELEEPLELEETFSTSKNTDPNPLNLMVNVVAPALSKNSSPANENMYGSTPMFQANSPPITPQTKAIPFIITLAVSPSVPVNLIGIVMPYCVTSNISFGLRIMEESLEELLLEELNSTSTVPF